MDNRKSTRIFANPSIRLSSLEGELVSKPTVNNISKGGALVVFHDPSKSIMFGLNERVKFKLTIPTGQISGLAEISWSNYDESQMGLRFIDIDSESSLPNLIAFISNRLLDH